MTSTRITVDTTDQVQGVHHTHGPTTHGRRPTVAARTVVARLSADRPMLVQSLASPGTHESSPEIGSRPAHVCYHVRLCTVLSGTTTAHIPRTRPASCLHLCLPFVCSPTMSPLTSHPLILDTRAAVAPCPPAKVTAMVDDSAATSDLDGTPDVPMVTAEPAHGHALDL